MDKAAIDFLKKGLDGFVGRKITTNSLEEVRKACEKTAQRLYGPETTVTVEHGKEPGTVTGVIRIPLPDRISIEFRVESANS